MKNKSMWKSEDELKYVAGLVANMPDVEPPDRLIHSVMEHVRPKRLGLLKRAWLKVRSPISVTPLKMAAVGVSMMCILLFAVFFLRGTMDKEISRIMPVIQERGFKTIMLTLDFPNASRVDVIGSFNQWKTGDFRMRWDGRRGVWSLSLQLEGGRYAYAFLVDGKTVLQDPKALLQEEDGFGNMNSVLIIERNNGHETKI